MAAALAPTDLASTDLASADLACAARGQPSAAPDLVQSRCHERSPRRCSIRPSYVSEPAPRCALATMPFGHLLSTQTYMEGGAAVSGGGLPQRALT